MNRKVYPWLLVGLLSFNFGVVYFDRNALNFLMPLIQPELHLSNEQVGMLGSALSLSWALAGLLVGRLSDVLGRRKVILVIAAFVFSVAVGLGDLVRHVAADASADGICRGRCHAHQPGAHCGGNRSGAARAGDGHRAELRRQPAQQLLGPDRGREFRAGFRVAECILSRGFAGCGGGGADVVAFAGPDS
jgi:MFS family permease